MAAAHPPTEPERKRGADRAAGLRAGRDESSAASAPGDAHAPADLCVPPAALRLLAEEAARTGGQVARGYFGADVTIRLKEDRSEVSAADEAAQAAIVACIRALRPRDAFIAEETLHLPADQPPPANDVLCWVIDPIDGTRNFVRGIPAYVCSVAVMHGGMPVAGAVYDVPHDVLVSASRQEGLFVGGIARPPGPGSRGRARQAPPRPVVAIPSAPAGPIAARAHAWLDRYICRNLGTTAMHLALVATGELDGALSDNCRLWDIAAGCLLIAAAGGIVTDPAGAPLFPLDVGTYQAGKLPLLAARADLHAQLLRTGA